MSAQQTVTKAVFPVAGLGTRFLPATKVVAKELANVFNKPVIQWAVEEAIQAGITDFIFINGKDKADISRHFATDERLELSLHRKKKTDLLEVLERTNISEDRIHTCVQNDPQGLGHAVYKARKLIGNSPFALILPDVLMLPAEGQEDNCTRQMIDTYNTRGGGNIVAGFEVPQNKTQNYGILSVEGTGDVQSITDMVEKPAPGTAPSNLSIVGRYILQPEILSVLDDMIRNEQTGAGGEYQITDAMKKLMEQQSFLSLNFRGASYDCGDHVGALQGSLAAGMRDPKHGEAVKAAVRALGF